MGKVKVIIQNKQMKVKIPTGIRLLIRKCCNAVLDVEQFTEDAEVGVSFVDNDEIRALNKSFLQRDTQTDVLSFPMGENGVWDKSIETGMYLLGEIVISVEKAVEQAEMYNHSFQRDMAYLTVHSMLHLLGYDHEQGGLEARKMREKEEMILSSLGLARELSLLSDEEA